jgi:hypothetical protein
MRKVLALSAAAALAVGMAGPSMAAVKKAAPKLPKAKPLVVTDAAGDANAINDQSALLPAAPPEQSTPQGERTAADITGLSIARLDDTKSVKGIVMTMKLAAVPDKGTGYTFGLQDPSCADNSNGDVILFRYFYYLDGSTKAFVREICGTTDKSTPLTNVKVVGNDVVFTVPFAEMPSHMKLNTVLGAIQGYTVGLAGTASTTYLGVPNIDQTAPVSGYKIGQ